MDSANSTYVRYPGSQTTRRTPRLAIGPPSSIARSSDPTTHASGPTAGIPDRHLRAQHLCLHEQIAMGSPEFIIVIILTLHIGPQLFNIVFAVL